MSKMKKLFAFVMICLFGLGAIGGIGYCCYCGAYVIAVGVAALAFMAWPELKKYFTNLTL